MKRSANGPKSSIIWARSWPRLCIRTPRTLKHLDLVFLTDTLVHANHSLISRIRISLRNTGSWGNAISLLSFLLYQNLRTGILLSSWAPSASTVVKNCRQPFFRTHPAKRSKAPSIWLLIHRYIKSVTLCRRCASNS